MRQAGQRLIDFYKTQLGQDVLETAAGALISATGQAAFTDMTPEQIAISTALGIGAAAVGRPVIGRAGQYIGKQVNKNSRNLTEVAKAMVDLNNVPEGILRESMRAKLAPYAHLSAPEQVGQLFGRGYGDNVMQGAVALAAPFVMPQTPEQKAAAYNYIENVPVERTIDGASEGELLVAGMRGFGPYANYDPVILGSRVNDLQQQMGFEPVRANGYYAGGVAPD